MRGRSQTAVIGFLAMVAAATALTPVLATLRPYLALPLILLLPGLAVLRAVLRRGDFSFEIVVLSCGLSLAISVVVGMLLNVGGFLTPLGWVGALGGVTLVACAVDLSRDQAPNPGCMPAAASLKITIGQAAIFVAAASIAVCGVAIARVGAIAQREYSYTEFWMVPRQPVEQNVVTIGIRNEEKVTTGYRVAIIVDGAMIGRWPPVSLDPDATWSVDISMNSAMRRSKKVEAWLYREDDLKEVYRKVWLASPTN